MFFKSISFFLVLLFAILAEISAENKISQKLGKNARFLFETNSENFSSKCGGTLGSSSGKIVYKKFASVEPNERCVWILRNSNATAYSVTITSLGIPSSVIISGVGVRASVRQYVPTSPTTISLTSSNLAIITFYTGQINSSSSNRIGFSLTFRATTIGTGQRASTTSQDVLIPAREGHIKYPSGQSAYGNFDLSTFVVKPVHNAMKVFRTTELTFINLQLESCCDSLKVYVFDTKIGSTNKWQLLGEINNEVESDIITNDDLILLIFQSDSSITARGFRLYSRVD